jgi:hypothetical protein
MFKTNSMTGPLPSLLQLSNLPLTLLTDAVMPVSTMFKACFVSGLILIMCEDRGDFRACEAGRDEKKDGRREEQRGERQIESGNIIGGLGNLIGGAATANQGQRQECRTGGRC